MKAVLDSIKAAHVILDDECIDDLRIRRCAVEKSGRVVVRIKALEGGAS